jgi:multiple sugar transport system ATP-binding protein
MSRQRSGRTGIKENETVKLALDMNKIHMFDKETEQAIFFNENYVSK